jgi:hypothetical protein
VKTRQHKHTFQRVVPGLGQTGEEQPVKKLATRGNAFLILAVVFMALGINNSTYIAIGAAFLVIGISLNARDQQQK